MSSRSFAGTDLTPSTPAVFFPWLSCVTRRTASRRAALDFVNSFWSFWTVRSLPHCSARKILFCMRYTCCSNLRQGSLRQLSLSGSSRSFPLGAFVFAIRLVALSSLSPCPRLHILDITPGFGFLGNPSLKCLRVVPCSPYRPPTRASLRVLPFR